VVSVVLGADRFAADAADPGFLAFSGYDLTAIARGEDGRDRAPRAASFVWIYCLSLLIAHRLDRRAAGRRDAGASCARAGAERAPRIMAADARRAPGASSA
jgi:hypothetical protein